MAPPPAGVGVLSWGGRRLPLLQDQRNPDSAAESSAGAEDESVTPAHDCDGEAPLCSAAAAEEEEAAEGGGTAALAEATAAPQESSSEEDAVAEEDEDGEVLALSAPPSLATGLPEALCPPLAPAPHPLRCSAVSDAVSSAQETLAAWLASAARGTSTAFWRVLGDGREARAPSAGWASPAFAAASSRTFKVPAVDVDISLDATAPLGAACARPSSDALASQRRALAATLAGHVVALCSRSAAADGCASYADLPCLGLALVREVVSRSLQPGQPAEPLLCLLTPVPPALLASADTLVAWSGAPDVSAQLLYRGTVLPRQDAFAFAPGSQLGAASGTRTAGDARKNLGRKRLGGGGGGRR